MVAGCGCGGGSESAAGLDDLGGAGLASLFRLNLVASQVGNHAVYPLEILLFPVFIKLGDVLFGTEKLPLQGHALWYAVKHHPWDTTRLLWSWEWHALIVWAVFAALAMPAIALSSEPVVAGRWRNGWEEGSKSS